MSFPIALLLLLFLFSSSPASASIAVPPTQRPYVIDNIKYYPIPSAEGYTDVGIASWYGPGFHGRKTSNGERYDMHGPTAAHKILPMNTMLLVENLENGEELIVRVNDRGPFVRGRIVDLSYAAAGKLGIVAKGTAKVRITALAAAKNGIIDHPDFSVGEFYVQIGAFREEVNALRLQKRFTEVGHRAVVVRYDAADGILYRVQVYTGTHLSMAKKAEAALLAKGYRGAFIVAR